MWNRIPRMGNVTHLLQRFRPRPHERLIAMSELAGPDLFAPDQEFAAWIRDAYLNQDGPFYAPEHAHLENAVIGCLWTNAPNSSKGRRIVGQAEMPSRSLVRSGKWQKARQEQQMREWFGVVPDFVLTFDALYANDCDDASFCALVDHELCHCAQAEDEFGAPKFTREGAPVFTIRGHDVEEFVSVVRRWGIQAAGDAATDLVIAAAQQPLITPAKLAQGCGTCMRKAA